MSIIQSGIDVRPTNIASEYVNKQSSENNISLAKNIDNNIKQTKTMPQQEVDDNLIESKVLTPKQLESVAQQLQDFVGDMNRGLEFSVDKDSGRDVIKVIDKSSGDLVKQYPSEEVLSLVAKLSDMVGGFIDAKV